MPNSKEIEGNWNELKGKLKQKYADLTDDDLLYTTKRKKMKCGVNYSKKARLKN
jgi:uncharacterized protein YjbJ (UPF0337 family)